MSPAIRINHLSGSRPPLRLVQRGSAHEAGNDVGADEPVKFVAKGTSNKGSKQGERAELKVKWQLKQLAEQLWDELDGLAVASDHPVAKKCTDIAAGLFLILWSSNQTATKAGLDRIVEPARS